MATGEKIAFVQVECGREIRVMLPYRCHNPKPTPLCPPLLRAAPSCESSPQTSVVAPGWHCPPQEWGRCNIPLPPGSATCTWGKQRKGPNGFIIYTTGNGSLCIQSAATGQTQRRTIRSEELWSIRTLQMTWSPWSRFEWSGPSPRSPQTSGGPCPILSVCWKRKLGKPNF